MAAPQVRFSSLSPRWQNLIRRMQKVNFGFFENLRFDRGEPDLRDDFRCVEIHRFPGDNTPRREIHLKDFVLPQEMQEFYHTFESVFFLEVPRTDIRHGLPFRVEIEDTE